MDLIGDIFTLLLLDPMINVLILLNNVFFGSFGLALIAFTILIRAITFPLTLRQLRQTRALQELQPRVQEIQKKHSDPKRRQQETLAAYREAGVNPLGCLGPLVIQFPILIALFYAIQRCLAVSPESLENLSNHLYSWHFIQAAVPLEESFLGLDLRHPNLFMVFLVALTTWGQSKTTVTVATSETARQQQQMMTWMLPLMFGFFALTFPSGLSLYWTVSSIVSIVFNIVTYGLPILNIKPVIRMPAPAAASAAAVTAGASAPPAREAAKRQRTTTDGQRRKIRRNKRQNRRRGNS
jgi:YidC/Oxa1 family membrane protein insertase